MKIITKYLTLKTKGDGDYHDITPQVKASFEKTGLKEGNVVIFVGGSTAGLTTFEFEPGLRKDIKELLERLIPKTQKYQHNMRWHDGNGYAHVRSAICKPTFCVPFSRGKLLLGTWQQIVFLEFDNRPRGRKIILQFIGQ
jgi:secondary thiamine-phosphate synthase enzyme